MGPRWKPARSTTSLPGPPRGPFIEGPPRGRLFKGEMKRAQEAQRRVFSGPPRGRWFSKP